MKATLFFLIVVVCVVAITAEDSVRKGKGEENGKGKLGSHGPSHAPVESGQGKGKGVEKGDAAARAEAGKAHAKNGAKGKEHGKNKY